MCICKVKLCVYRCGIGDSTLAGGLGWLIFQAPFQPLTFRDSV